EDLLHRSDADRPLRVVRVVAMPIGIEPVLHETAHGIAGTDRGPDVLGHFRQVERRLDGRHARGANDRSATRRIAVADAEDPVLYLHEVLFLRIENRSVVTS